MLIMFWLFAIAFLTSLSAQDISSGVSRPAGKFAVDDMGYVLTKGLDESTINVRNERLVSDTGAGVHRYNLYWASVEPEKVGSSKNPIDCPSGYEQMPSDASGLKSNGGKYNKYRCVRTGQITQWQELIDADASAGMQSAGILWCTAVKYRDPDCIGITQSAIESEPADASPQYTELVQQQSARIESAQQFLSAQQTSLNNGSAGIEASPDASGCSCVPTLDSMPDYADFVTLLADELGPNLQHFIVFNEAASSLWTDMSPTVDTRSPAGPEAVSKWVEIYAQLMTETHDSLAAVGHKGLVYASIDKFLSVPPYLTSWNLGRTHIGGYALLAGLWNIIGTKWEFAIGSHPYGEVFAQEFGQGNDPEAYTFVSLANLSAWSTQQRIKAGGDGSVIQQIAATEQGVEYAKTSDDERAKYMCDTASAVMDVPEVTWVAMNEFQMYAGSSWGLLGESLAEDLSDAEKSIVYQSFEAWKPGVWGVDKNNYCCKTYQLGCPS